jgi:hypothetical protein
MSLSYLVGWTRSSAGESFPESGAKCRRSLLFQAGSFSAG